MTEFANPTTIEELEQQREEVHKAMRQNKNWLWETDNGHLICRCKNCGCGHIIPFYAYENPYNYCYHCGHSAADPRVISLDELNTTSGAGWIEVWLEGDPDEGMEEEKFLTECGWCKGNYITDDGDFSIADYIQTHYNKKYGIRIWTAKPTDEQREAVRWDDE